MNFLSPLNIFLCIQLSLWLLGSTAASVTSLWGNKVQFNGRPCLWQLQPGVVVPALTELSVCTFLRRNIATKWTGFDYKAPGERNAALGLTGTNKHLSIWLFGMEKELDKEVIVNEWYSVCLTWSDQAQRLRIYINESILHEAHMNLSSPQQLAPNGTLTLGVSHYTDTHGVVKAVDGNKLIGEIGLFRIWSRELSSEELKKQTCADGDVVRWDLQHWHRDGCPPQPDKRLVCEWSSYKINMQALMSHSSDHANCSDSLEGVTRNWLEKIFPHNISVDNISVSSPSHTCHRVNNTAAPHVQQPQRVRAPPAFPCNKCFSCEVYVNVNPAVDVKEVQLDITKRLRQTSSINFLKLTADPNSISVLPVELFPLVTNPTTTASTNVSETGPTVSRPDSPTNTSTTEDPSDLNETVSVGPDTFFRVNMTLSMIGPANPKDIDKWLKDTLEVNRTMVVLNLITSDIMKDNAGRNTEQNNGEAGRPAYGQRKQYYCTFHIQEYNINSVAEIITSVKAALTTKYEHGSIIIQAMGVEIKHIMPENCKEETTATIYGEYIWPEAFPQVNQEMRCYKPASASAYRLCKLSIETDTTSWAEPNMTNCRQLVTISDLDNITVTTGNAAEIVDMLQDLVDVQLGNSEVLSSSELDSVVEKLNEVVNISIIKPVVGADIVNIISDILLSDTDVTPVANSVLKMADRLGDNMDLQNESLSVTAPSLALSMINVETDRFSGLTFGVSVSSNLNPTTFVNTSFESKPVPGADVMISLPYEICEFFTTNTTRVQFQFYGTKDLFQDPFITDDPKTNWTLNSHIVSASIKNSPVSNLSAKDRVVVTLRLETPVSSKDNLQCVFWDFQKNSGRGGWNSTGCEIQSISSYQTSCLCHHLTHFAVLLDVSRNSIHDPVLTVISNIGCGISSIFLGITILTYLAFEKLRKDNPSKILMNLSAALLGLSMFFLLDSWLSSFYNYGLCIATAATLHYFLLASFTWMGLEGVHMYFSLVKVFNIYFPYYILKFCIVGWGLPLVIVSLVLAIDKDAYGNVEKAEMRQSADPFCWIQNDVLFYVMVMAFILLILLCNMCVFVVVLIQIRRMRVNKPSANSSSSLHDMRAVASLTVLLGLTWSIGFFSFGPGEVVLMYLFTIFNTMQGFFVFLFHCLMKENVRKQWRIHLCCGRFRLNDDSVWSRSVTAGGQCKKLNLVNSDSVASDNTTSSRKVSDSSSAPNHHHHQGA